MFLSLVLQLHREFALAGADVLQAFVFNGTNDRLNKFRDKDNLLDVSNIIFEFPPRNKQFLRF